MRYLVRYSDAAQHDLAAIFEWVADRSSSQVAEQFVMDIYALCDGLSDFPYRGRSRDDLSPGLRALGFRIRAVIAFTIASGDVIVHGVYYGGRDYETIMRNHPAEG